MPMSILSFLYDSMCAPETYLQDFFEILKRFWIIMNEWLFIQFTDMCEHMGITFIRCLDPKIVLSHICQMNRTLPQSKMPAGSKHVVGPYYAPLLIHQFYLVNAEIFHSR